MEYINDPVVRRLPRYYRILQELHKNGAVDVNSSELAFRMGNTASQVRQDMRCFGTFGVQGRGYPVDYLMERIRGILFRGEPLCAILIGAGRLGAAISKWLSTEAEGCRLIGIFEADSGIIGRELCGISVQPVDTVESFCRVNHVDTAVLCVPEGSARRLLPVLEGCGISGYLNFSHYNIAADHPQLLVENIHLGDSLASLGYRQRERLAMLPGRGFVI